jgi:hypothetical protein
MASVGSSQDPPETGNRRARAAIGAPAEPAGRGFLARRGWFKDSRAVGSRRRTASCSLKRIWRSCALRDSHSSQNHRVSFRRQASQQSPISRPLARSQRAIAHFGRILLDPVLVYVRVADGRRLNQISLDRRRQIQTVAFRAATLGSPSRQDPPQARGSSRR